MSEILRFHLAAHQSIQVTESLVALFLEHFEALATDVLHKAFIEAGKQPQAQYGITPSLVHQALTQAKQKRPPSRPENRVISAKDFS